ncbi:gluconate 2-dehydrogenase [Candidatus Bathyarchaeota archaeon]|nr:gluconate 2-dehydrogenase [Candidatus Bathyarchaeota archaeon]
MAKVLVLYDSWITSDAKEMWRTALTEALGDGFMGHQICFADNIQGSFNWSTEVVDGVKEAHGDPDYIIDQISVAEVVLTGYAPFTRKMMEAAPKLKIIGVSRGGPVNVDHRAATDHGIIILKAVGRNAVSVADQTMGLILSESRNIARQNLDLKTGRYFEELEAGGRQKYMDSFRWVELEGKTLGLIGYGQVGSRVAKRALAFDMRVMVYDPYVEEARLSKDRCVKAELDALLKESDFVSIHTMLTPETEHMIDERALILMKPTAMLVNTARGGIIDEAALYQALKERRIHSAALDVFEEDPVKKSNPLLGLDNVTATPHSAGRSPEVEVRGYRQVAQQAAVYLKGLGVDPMYVSNRDVMR